MSDDKNVDSKTKSVMKPRNLSTKVNSEESRMKHEDKTQKATSKTRSRTKFKAQPKSKILITRVQLNPETGEQYLEWPNSWLQVMGWKIGDVLVWAQMADGDWLLGKPEALELLGKEGQL